MKQAVFFVLFIVGIVFGEVVSDYVSREHNGKKLCLVKEHGRFLEWSQKYAAKKASKLNQKNSLNYFFVEVAGTSTEGGMAMGRTGSSFSTTTTRFYTVLEFSECQ